MTANIVVDISPPIPYLGKFWFPIDGPKCWQPVDDADFLPADKHKSFL